MMIQIIIILIHGSPSSYSTADLILGGYHKRHLKSTEIYHKKSNDFRPGHKLPKGTYSQCAVKRHSTQTIYIVGGKTRGGISIGFLSSVLAFDLGDSHLKVLPGKMTTGRAGMGCHILEEKGKLLVAGGVTIGFKTTQLMEVLDLATGVWSSLKNTPKTGRRPGYFQLGNRLAFMDQDHPTLVYQYDHAHDEWITIPSSSSPAHLTRLHTTALKRRDFPLMC